MTLPDADSGHGDYAMTTTIAINHSTEERRIILELEQDEEHYYWHCAESDAPQDVPHFATPEEAIAAAYAFWDNNAWELEEV